MWIGSAPWANNNSTTAKCPPAQANDRTVWSLVDVALFTSAPVKLKIQYKFYAFENKEYLNES